MATILKAGNVASGAQITSDSTGILEIKTGTGAGTTAMTLGADQAVTMAGAVSSSSLTVNSNNISAVNSLGFRNRIINGDCRIDQRNNGASVTPTNGQYLVDRFKYYSTQNSKVSVQQNAGSVTPPAGFKNYLGVTSLSSYSVLSSDYFAVTQLIEGFNMADLGYGAAGASTVTLSFWVRSSLTGTFGGSLTNDSANYAYPFTYTISAANTWEQKAITITGATAGTWLTTNGTGIQVIWSLGAGATFSGTPSAWVAAGFLPSATGAVSVVGTNGATFYITGVQLEAGSVATPFERRDYGRELIMCQRYTYRHSAEGDIDNFAPLGQGRYYGTNAAQLYVPFKVTMRTSPSSVTQVGNVFVNDTGFGGSAITLSLNETSSSGATLTGAATTGTTAGNATTFYANGTSSAALIFSAEL
jgi:hypothetical protein